MKKLIFPTLMACTAIGVLSIVSCEKEKTSTTNTNSTKITYDGNIKALLSDKGCTGCHGATNPKVDSYTNAKNNITKILGSIKHEVGYDKMPQGGNKLSDAEIKLVEDWNSQGLLEK